ncbi:MAG: SdpI/YhfL protein family [Bacteroidota bacterium]|nr:SdpI/YhfL protein family [Bacteroidota bacterium]
MNLIAIMMLPQGVIFVLLGYLHKKYPPKKVNTWVGYRTPSSRNNADTWAAAQTYSANFMMVGGIVFVLLGLISLTLPITGNPQILILMGMVPTVIFAILLVIANEMHLRKLFDENGNRRS